MRRLVKVALAAGVVGWLHAIGALDPGLWAATIRRERERLPAQLREAMAAGRRAAAAAEDELERDLREGFRAPGPPD